MKITNIGVKIVNFGTRSLLPGEAGEIDDIFKDNAALKIFEKKKFIVISEDTATKAAAEKQAAAKADAGTGSK